MDGETKTEDSDAKTETADAKPDTAVASGSATAAPTIKLDDVRPKKAETPAPAATAEPPKSARTSKPAPAPAKAAAPSRGPIERAMTFAEAHGYQAAGALVVLGIGWIIGANSFDNHASERRVAEALVALDRKIETVSGKLVSPAEVAGLKHNLAEMKRAVDGSRRTTAAIADLRGKLDAAERARVAAAEGLVDKVAERLGKEQGERLDKLAARLDKIESQLASQIPTASIPTPQAKASEPVQIPGVTMPMASATPASSRDRSATTAHARPPENGYVLREVYNGVALVEGRRGLMEVGPGDSLPGAGRVRSIERRNRKWVVVTSNGVIDTSGY